jgi:hypothetical protein
MSKRAVRTSFLLLALSLLIVACRAATSPEIDPVTDAQPIAGDPPSGPNAASVDTPTVAAPTVTPPLKVVATPLVVESVPDVTLDVELFYFEHWMRVRQTVVIENTSPDAWDEVVFNVPINWMEDAFYPDSATVQLGGAVQEGYPFSDNYETVLRVPLYRPARPGEVIEIELRYRVVIPPVASTDWPPIGTTGWTFDLIQAGEWYPALVPYHPGEGWHTWRYHPVGDPTVYPLVNCHLNVTTEEGVQVASGGFVGQEGNTWRFEVQGARGIAFLASERYQMVEREIDGIPVRSFYLPEHTLAGEAALDIAVEALALFSDLYGPYPYADLTVAENGFLGGMEYSALASVSDAVYVAYGGEPPSILHALVAHEIAHQWWYGAVGNDQVNEPWLDESLAFYSELLYFERYLPDLTDWWWVKRVDQYHPYGPVDVTIYGYDYSADFILSMYGQAARFTDALRELMGDEAFFAFTQDYYATYSGQIVTASDYFETLERHTDADLTPLLEEYFANLDTDTPPEEGGDSASGAGG